MARATLGETWTRQSTVATSRARVHAPRCGEGSHDAGPSAARGPRSCSTVVSERHTAPLPRRSGIYGAVAVHQALAGRGRRPSAADHRAGDRTVKQSSRIRSRRCGPHPPKVRSFPGRRRAGRATQVRPCSVRARAAVDAAQRRPHTSSSSPTVVGAIVIGRFRPPRAPVSVLRPTQRGSRSPPTASGPTPCSTSSRVGASWERPAPPAGAIPLGACRP